MAAQRSAHAWSLIVFASILAVTYWLSATAWAAQVVISCGSLGKEFEVCREGAQAWARKTGNSVEILAASGSAGERLSQMQLLLAAKSSDIDIFLLDTTWPGMLSEFFDDLAADPALKAASSEHFPSFVSNNTVDGRLIAMPWFIDAGVLYYRKDLLEKHGAKPPQTWDELTQAARRIQEAERKAGNERFWGFVFQARAYEGLTCNALEWIANEGGGSIVDPEGKVTVRNAHAARGPQLHGGGGARGLSVRQRGFHAQLALRVEARERA